MKNRIINRSDEFAKRIIGHFPYDSSELNMCITLGALVCGGFYLFIKLLKVVLIVLALYGLWRFFV